MVNPIFTREGPKRALVTGASGGIGEAFARLLAEEGWDLALVARNAEQLNRVAGVVHAEHGIEAHALPADLGDAAAIGRLAERLAAMDFRPDVLINNAGFGLMGRALELDREEQLRMIDLNVRAVVDLTLRLLPYMRDQGMGGVLNVASITSFMPGPGMAVYYATKAAVLSFSEALAEEMRGHGVQVSALCPGPVPTGFQDRANMHGSRAMKLLPKLPAQRVARAGWQGFKEGRAVIVPGLLNSMLVMSGRYAPRALVRRVNAWFTGAHRGKREANGEGRRG